jgi:hypothetical protein
VVEPDSTQKPGGKNEGKVKVLWDQGKGHSTMNRWGHAHHDPAELVPHTPHNADVAEIETAHRSKGATGWKDSPQMQVYFDKKIAAAHARIAARKGGKAALSAGVVPGGVVTVPGVGGPGPSTVTAPARSWSPLGGEGVGSRKHEPLLAAPSKARRDPTPQSETDTGTPQPTPERGAGGNPENPAASPKPPALATTKGADVSALHDLEVKLAGVRHVRDVAYWKLPEGTPIVAHPKLADIQGAPVGSKVTIKGEGNRLYVKKNPNWWEGEKRPGQTEPSTRFSDAEMAAATAKNPQSQLATTTKYGGAEKATGTTKYVGQFKVRGGTHYDLHQLSAQDAADFGTPGATHMLVGRHGHIIGKVEKHPQSKGEVKVPDWPTRKGVLSRFTPAVAEGNEPLTGHATTDNLGQQTHNRPTPKISKPKSEAQSVGEAGRAHLQRAQALLAERGPEQNPKTLEGIEKAAQHPTSTRIAREVARKLDDFWAKGHKGQDASGFGYLGARKSHREFSVGEARTVDTLLAHHAKANNWSDDRLFAWANSKAGRHFGDIMFGGAPTKSFADRFREAQKAGVLDHEAYAKQGEAASAKASRRRASGAASVLSPAQRKAHAVMRGK